MLVSTRKPTSPGQILHEHYLKPRDISISLFAEAVGCSRKHLSNIIHGKARIDAKAALRIAALLGTTPQFWLNLQNTLDLFAAKQHARNWRPPTFFTESIATV